MKKFLFPILSIVFFLFIVSFLWRVYGYYEMIHRDDPITPYVSTDSGSLTIGRGDIAIDLVAGENYNIQEDDILMSKSGSLVVLHWPDHSTTRLGSDTRATIKRMRVADDYSSIEIELALEQGKVWNTVIRTIYPKSYFRTRIPENNVIAGVRGTIYEINLEKKYIHSVNHSIVLSDGLGRANTLLPGDVVATTDIMKKLTQLALDVTWNQMNIFRDTADAIIHSSQAKKTLDMLREAQGLYDRFVRWILSFSGAFRDIQVVESLQKTVSGSTADLPPEYVLKWYQRFQDTDFIEQRENIRATLVHTWTHGDEMINVLARGALWDRMSFSGMTLKGTDALIGQYIDTLDTKIQGVLNVVPAAELQNKAKETLRNLMK